MWLKLDDQALRVALEIRLGKHIHKAKLTELNREQIKRLSERVKERQGWETIEITNANDSYNENLVEDEDADFAIEKEVEVATLDN
ncbi:uncharacterized protein Triagg1_5477 [Trichoderma aggressivum f. europaeum]|uniref:Uncharacterized protein n=1 Tax=Trichoderma aggressivum f. europaeum TaxID=173218 RepID=A0AAE1M2N9_9HYPO|nr:hypothetical protein Triagg1_5477 [Trichoderma aggressivum f. europaeum]